MQLSPNVTLTGTTVPMSNGFRGIEQTIRTMRQLVNQFKTDATIRQVAMQIVFLTPEKDEYSEIESIFNFVRDHIRYVKDVYGVETLALPTITLATRMGDCDDQSVLLASLLESIGYPTQFVIAGYNAPGVYEHVYVRVLCNRATIGMDATEQQYLGWEPADPACLMTENV
jgi:transglutaminase-like putative cysteine protease